METNKTIPDGSGQAEAPRLLETLRSDREAFAGRMHAPRWLAPGFGLAAAAYVAIPAVSDDATRNFLFLAAVAVSTALMSSYPRVTWVKASRFSAGEWGLFTACILGALVLLSVSFGLAAAELRWWIIASGAAAFAWVTWLAGRLTSAARERVRRGR